MADGTSVAAWRCGRSDATVTECRGPVMGVHRIMVLRACQRLCPDAARWLPRPLAGPSLSHYYVQYRLFSTNSTAALHNVIMW